MPPGVQNFPSLLQEHHTGRLLIPGTGRPNFGPSVLLVGSLGALNRPCFRSFPNSPFKPGSQKHSPAKTKSQPGNWKLPTRQLKQMGISKQTLEPPFFLLVCLEAKVERVAPHVEASYTSWVRMAHGTLESKTTPDSANKAPSNAYSRLHPPATPADSRIYIYQTHLCFFRDPQMMALARAPRKPNKHIGLPVKYPVLSDFPAPLSGKERKIISAVFVGGHRKTVCQRASLFQPGELTGLSGQPLQARRITWNLFK